MAACRKSTTLRSDPANDKIAGLVARNIWASEERAFYEANMLLRLCNRDGGLRRCFNAVHPPEMPVTRAPPC
jgi:hypothetical protein